uniref:Uncharacterized protein n=1 Tax=Pipistrellus kuhlii TaxID=59472 RepID=A0A7J7YWW0_PIPKU|nr:hypothetical protein mPipKuh1_009915 [Pipistrellus kuhlii]
MFSNFQCSSSLKILFCSLGVFVYCISQLLLDGAALTNRPHISVAYNCRRQLWRLLWHCSMRLLSLRPRLKKHSPSGCAMLTEEGKAQNGCQELTMPPKASTKLWRFSSAHMPLGKESTWPGPM